MKKLIQLTASVLFLSQVIACGSEDEEVLSYTIGGDVSGLNGAVTLSNSADNLTINSDGSYTFPTAVDSGKNYNVSVNTQPSNQICLLTNASGSVASANITNVQLDCVTQYKVGGSIGGLNGIIELANNNETLSLTADGSFQFANNHVEGDSFAVSVSSQPEFQTCSVLNSSGAIATQDISNVEITCVENIISMTGFVKNYFTGDFIPNADVTISQNDAELDNTVADANGFYILDFPQRTDGRIVLSANAADFSRQSNISRIVSGTELQSRNILLQPIQSTQVLLNIKTTS